MTKTQSTLTRLDRLVSSLEGTEHHTPARAAVRATLQVKGYNAAIKHAKRIRDNYAVLRAHDESLPES